jgi:hypothetical protein
MGERSRDAHLNMRLEVLHKTKKQPQNTDCPGQILCYERYSHISQTFLPIPTPLLLQLVFPLQ